MAIRTRPSMGFMLTQVLYRERKLSFDIYLAQQQQQQQFYLYFR